MAESQHGRRSEERLDFAARDKWLYCPRSPPDTMPNTRQAKEQRHDDHS
jgi:hypothetical protein